jgi:hypothetical protein
MTLIVAISLLLIACDRLLRRHAANPTTLRDAKAILGWTGDKTGQLTLL